MSYTAHHMPHEQQTQNSQCRNRLSAHVLVVWLKIHQIPSTEEWGKFLMNSHQPSTLIHVELKNMNVKGKTLKYRGKFNFLGINTRLTKNSSNTITPWIHTQEILELDYHCLLVAALAIEGKSRALSPKCFIYIEVYLVQLDYN